MPQHFVVSASDACLRESKPGHEWRKQDQENSLEDRNTSRTTRRRLLSTEVTSPIDTLEPNARHHFDEQG